MSEAAGEIVVASRDQHVLTLQMNRPDRMNAVSLELYESLESLLQAADEDRAIRAVVLTGAGRAFCVGADLDAHADGIGTDDARRRYVDAAQRVSRRLRTLSKITIAAAGGHAIGAGFELLLSCDLAVVGRDSKYRLPELSLGTFVGGGVTHDLVRRVGRTTANEILFLGEMLSGEKLVDLGLANRAVGAEEAIETAADLAARCSKLAPLSVARAKAILARMGELSLDELLAAEAQALLDCMGTEDWAEGIAAFHSKRDPEFKGR